MPQQQALVELATAEGRALEAGLASPALVLAVKVSMLDLQHLAYMADHSQPLVLDSPG